ncbi:MMPL family transporter [Amycolatopsis methanolica]|uniref:RND superfamily protein-like exporter n=1 Tax=Amycolatopsis methanolica 239 TaxID=1068978 RepID=A0A076MKD0_AMYME|nr:MMPL family transporter [Amycolatopsis methanolica]AIJ21308.1 RND superfamily protein-like exporter [Amycolatopsis methanolica 239]
MIRVLRRLAGALRRWWRGISRRGLVAGAVLLALAACTGGGLWQVRIDTGIESFLPTGDPAYQALQDKARSFGGDPVVVLLRSKDPNDLLMQQEKLAGLLGLEGQLAKLPDVAAVYGPATVLNQIAGAAQDVLAQISGRRDALRNTAEQQARANGARDADVRAAGDAAVAQFDARYGPLIVRGLPTGLPTLRNPRFVATAMFQDDGRPRPEWRFVVPDDHTATLLIRPREDIDQAATGRLVDSVRSSVDHAGLGAAQVTVTGVPAVTSALTERARQEFPVLGAIALTTVGLIFLLVPWTRRRWTRLRPLLAAMCGTAITVALFGWLHRPLSLGVVAFLPILLGIGSDFPYYLFQRDQLRRVLVAALAAALGFASLVLSPLPFVGELGLALGIGIVATVGVALFLRRMFGVEEAQPTSGGRPLPRGTRRWRIAVAVVAIALAGLGWTALPRLGIEADPQQLAKGLTELTDAQRAEQVLGSAGEVSIMVRGKDVSSPQVLQWARQAEESLVRGYGRDLHPIITIDDLLQFLGDNPTAEQIDAAKQLMPAYLTSAVLRQDDTAGVLVFGVDLRDLYQQRDLLAHVQASLPAPPAGYHAELVGLPVAAVRGLDLVSGGRILINIVSVLVAGLVLTIGLGRRDALRGVLTVLLASGWVLALAWTVIGSLSPLTVAIGSLTTATGCEFAVMMAKPGHGGRRWLFRGVGTTALAGSVGYLVLACSGLAVLSQFGLLLASGVVCSYVAALLVVWLVPPHAAQPAAVPAEPEVPALAGKESVS